MNKINDLKKYEPLYIIGHKRPDVDTMVSSYLLCNIFNYLGIKSYYCILSSEYEIDKYNKRIIDDYLNYNPVIIDVKNIKNYNFVLVDHNDPNQSVGLSSNIAFCIDHHKNSNKLDNLILTDLCSNSLFIYDYFKDIYNFNAKEKELVMLAVLTDTLFLKTDRYKDKDKILVKELGISMDSNKLLEKYFIETDLSMGLDKYLEKSDRDFTYYGISFTSSVIQLLKVKDTFVHEYRDAIKRMNQNHLGMLRDLINNKTYVIFKINNEVIEFNYDFIASRASTVIPDVIRFLKKK